jgi:maltose O-acetyltransferase
VAIKTEWQKMLAGEAYLASDPELVRARARARRLTRRYNLTTEDELDQRLAILKELCGAVGANVWIEPPFYCDYGTNLFLADGAYMNFGCVILDCNTVRFGKNVKLGPAVQIYAAYHPVPADERLAGPEFAAPITVEDNVWIGGGAIICPGVTIGRNTTIGAGSVVVQDIPANVVAAGNPCRVVRQLA